MALLFLVRHGQASFGAADYDRLSDLGRKQSRWLGEYFHERGIVFTRALAGALTRQQATATEILAAMGRPPAVTIDAGLDEYPAEALYAAHTGGRDLLAHQRADYRDYWRTMKAALSAWAIDELPGVPETWSGFGARTGAALAAACRGLARDECALAVSSGGAIGRALIDIIDSPGATAIEFHLRIRNTGVCEIIAGGDSMRLVTFNALPHLDAPGRRDAITFA